MRNDANMLKRMVKKENEEHGTMRDDKRIGCNSSAKETKGGTDEYVCPENSITARSNTLTSNKKSNGDVMDSTVSTSTAVGIAINSVPAIKKTKIILEVTKEYKIAISPSSKAVTEALIKFRTAQYDVKSDAWQIALCDYGAAVKELCKHFVFDRIPNDNIRILNKYSMKMENEDFVDSEVIKMVVVADDDTRNKCTAGNICDERGSTGSTCNDVPVYTFDNACRERVRASLTGTAADCSPNHFTFSHLKTFLLLFQKHSVNKAILNGRRIILADSIGLGKTIQALCIALYYSSEWPLLIVAPASLLDNWRDEIEKFCGMRVCVVRDTGDIGDECVFVVSYDFLSKNVAHFEDMAVGRRSSTCKRKAVRESADEAVTCCTGDRITVENFGRIWSAGHAQSARTRATNEQHDDNHQQNQRDDRR